MKIEFDPGEVGYYEARELWAMARSLLNVPEMGRYDVLFIDFLEKTAEQHMNRPEFNELRQAEDRIVSERLRASWARVMSAIPQPAQPKQALEYREWSPRGSSEAMVGDLRAYSDSDDALAKVAELESRLDQLQQLLDRVTIEVGLPPDMIPYIKANSASSDSPDSAGGWFPGPG